MTSRGFIPPVTFTAPIVHRDRHLCMLGTGRVRLDYLPDDPYAIHLYIADPHGDEDVHWIGSRDAFISAGMHGVPLPGLDMVVTAVMAVTPGGRGGRVLRVALHGSYEDGDASYHNGEVLHLDLALDYDLRSYLERIIEIVPPGTESRHLDLDGAISQLLGTGR